MQFALKSPAVSRRTGIRGTVFVVMGVSGCGKSTVAEALAERLDGDFLDADDFHSPSNIEKMRQGIALTAEDRRGWLASLADALTERAQQERPTILACSALRESYRQVLRVHADVRFVYLKGSFEVIEARMRSRKGHFMNPALLKSQFALLEEPACGPGTDGIAVDVTLSVESIVDQTLAASPFLVSHVFDKESR